MAYLADAAGLVTERLPDHVRLRRRGELTFAFNYGEEAWEGPEAEYVLGTRHIGPQSLAAWRSPEA